MKTRSGLIFAAAFAATLVGGCAAPNGTQKASDDEEKLYVTGSRIPVKENATGPVSSTADRKTIENVIRPRGTVGGGSN